MKKYRFLFITFVVISLFAIAPCVFAENIKVDCGKFDSVSGYNFAKGQPTISVWEFLPQKTEIKVQYKVKVAEAGTYAIVFQGSDPNVTYCSPYKIQVNGENETQAAGKPLINRVDAIVATYDMGYFPLHQGENTITFLCDTPCVDNGRFSWWLNYFELKYVSDWKIYETTGSEACNVWTKQQPVCFDLKFTRQENEPKNCYFIIKDFWGKEVLNENFTTPAYQSSFPLFLGRFESGWYTLEVGAWSDNIRTPMIHTKFSVVPEPNKKNGEAPVMFDVFNTLKNHSPEKLDGIIRAAKLAGTDMIRERLIFEVVGAEKGKFNYTTTDLPMKAAAKQDLDVLSIMQGMPSWTSSNGTSTADDLFDLYHSTKNISAHYRDSVKAWEYQNEVDTNSKHGTADVYAAQFKAAALGFTDGNPNALVSASSMALYPTETKQYYDILMQNDIMRYSSFFNFHRYGSLNVNAQMNNMPDDKVDAMVNLANAYDRQNKPVWSTESATPAKEGAERLKADSQLQAETRSNIIQAIEQMSRGEDRYTHFSFPAQIEAETVFGMFDTNYHPYPLYTAMAVLNKTLGKGQMIGKMGNLPEKAHGFLFDTGKNETSVLWADGAEVVKLKTQLPVSVTDIMGKSRVILPTNGVVEVTASYDVIYVTYQNGADKADFFPLHYVRKTAEPVTFDTAQRVVIQPKMQPYTADTMTAGYNSGYLAVPNQSYEVLLEIYNFNSEPIKGVLRAEAESGYSAELEKQEIKIDAMSKQVVKATVHVSADVTQDETKTMTFFGDFDGGTVLSALGFVCRSGKIVPPDDILGGSLKKESYRKNQGTGDLIITQAEKGVQFGLKGMKDWWFPYFKIQGDDAQRFSDYDGVLVTTYSDKAYNHGTLYLFAYYDDPEAIKFCSIIQGRIEKGYTQFKVPWDSFVHFAGPVPVMNPKDIKYLSFGMSGETDENMTFTMDGYGLYHETVIDGAEIRVSGIENGKVYSKGTPQLTAKLPKNPDIVPEETRVLLMDREVTYKIIGESEIHVDLSGLDKGAYKMLIVSYTKGGLAIRKQLEFYIEE